VDENLSSSSPVSVLAPHSNSIPKFFCGAIFDPPPPESWVVAKKMNKDKAPMPGDGGSGDGLPPQATRRAGAPPSSSTPPPEFDISRMPDFPTRNAGHRRAHSEILSLPDDLDLSAPGGGDGPSLSDENDEELFSMFLDVDKLNASCGASSEAEAESSSAAGGGGEGAELGHAPRPRHQHSQSMDGSMSIKAEQLAAAQGIEGMSSAEAKKAVSAAKLAELALVDPKRAKRYSMLVLVKFYLLCKLFTCYLVWLARFISET